MPRRYDDAFASVILGCVMLVWLAFLCWLCRLLLGDFVGTGLFGVAMLLGGIAIGGVLASGPAETVINEDGTIDDE